MASMSRGGRPISPSAGVVDKSRPSSSSMSLAVASRRARKGLILPSIVVVPSLLRDPGGLVAFYNHAKEPSRGGAACLQPDRSPPPIQPQGLSVTNDFIAPDFIASDFI